MSPTDPRHGEQRGYFAHRTAGQAACKPCLTAHARATKRSKFLAGSGRGTMVSPIGAERRLRALACLGWSTRRIAAHAGMSAGELDRVRRGHWKTINQKTADRISDVYDRLSMKIPEAANQYEQGAVTVTRHNAIASGWAPPLAWDDIDNDHSPARGSVRKLWSSSELAAEVHHLEQMGLTREEIASQLNLTTGALDIAIKRATQQAPGESEVAA